LDRRGLEWRLSVVGLMASYYSEIIVKAIRQVQAGHLDNPREDPKTERRRASLEELGSENGAR